MQYIELSKFISLILRHKPETINIELDKNGWANIDELIMGIKKEGFNIDFEILDKIVENDNKQRFTFNENKTKIRANQGHSIQIDLELAEMMPPSILYHGTGQKYLDNILKEGVKKKSRNYVHLSDNEEIAFIVGKRHGIPVVLKIDARQMSLDGCKFYKSKNNVWLTEYINPKYLIK